MRQIWDIAWRRFSANSAVIAEINGRFIATVFYCTVLVPFGLLSALFMDPLQKRGKASGWLQREPVSDDLADARQQG